MPLPGGYLLDTNILVHLLRNNAPGRSWRVDREWVDPSSKLPP